MQKQTFQSLIFNDKLMEPGQNAVDIIKAPETSRKVKILDMNLKMYFNKGVNKTEDHSAQKFS